MLQKDAKRSPNCFTHFPSIQLPTCMSLRALREMNESDRGLSKISFMKISEQLQPVKGECGVVVIFTSHARL